MASRVAVLILISQLKEFFEVLRPVVVISNYAQRRFNFQHTGENFWQNLYLSL